MPILKPTMAVLRYFTFHSFLLLLHLSLSTARSTTQLSRGSHLSDGDYLTSPDRTFTAGFYGSSNAYWFSVWFTRNPRPNAVVWTANRESSVHFNGSRLTLQTDGNLVLTGIGGSVAWQSNTISMAVDRVELLDTGNLVIRSPGDEILWQSFDHPTDTLLPAQPLTGNTKLVSGLGDGTFGSGYFNLFFDGDNVLKMIYNGPQTTSIYWPYPLYDTPLGIGRTIYNASRIAVLDDQGLFSSSDQYQITASDLGTPGIKRMLKMDHDGNLRLYSLNNSTASLDITYAAVAVPCWVHGLCGVNGICVYNKPDQHGCSCPPGYEPTNSNDWSQGCKPMFNKSCTDSLFVEMKNTDYYGFDLHKHFGNKYNFTACKQLCYDECSCQAFIYWEDGEAVCYRKTALYNGYSTPNYPGSIYIRLPTNSSFGSSLEQTVLNLTDVMCNQSGGNVVMLADSFATPGQHTRWVYLYSVASGLGVIEILMIACGWFFFFGKHGILASLEDGYNAIASQFRRFNYGELKRATNQFKAILGRGGFGVVYKGCLEDGRAIAVKRLGNVLGEKEFWAEVSTIGKIHHMNLVRMWGFCSERKHRLLVYEYIENGSLDKHLFSADSLLGWKERFKVAIGTARGLAYLHHECLEWIFHCDVKPENILLDADFEPKISDFGLAKLSQRGGSAGFRVTRIQGTKGYMAPEWAFNLPITSKVDAYSYGVVILELVKGIRLSNLVEDGGNGEKESELTRLLERLTNASIEVDDDNDSSWVEGIVDPRLEGEFSRKQIGVSCLEENRNKRPTMESVAQLLLECEDSEAGRP